jgi:nitrate/nitrite-specific signal transduction histidine kinase
LSSSFLWQANRRLHANAPLCERISPVLNGLQGLTLLRDAEVAAHVITFIIRVAGKLLMVVFIFQIVDPHLDIYRMAARR